VIKQVKQYVPAVWTRHMDLIFESNDKTALDTFYNEHMVDLVESLDEFFIEMLIGGPIFIRLLDNGNEFIKWKIKFV